MSESATLTEDRAELEPLDWENLGGGPAGRAFIGSALELIVHPSRFFRRMALTGGLHEPLTFLALILGATIVLAFPAALASLGLAPSGAEAAAAGADYEMPARAAGLLLVMLPLVLTAGIVLVALTGSLFHAGGKAFGARNWEGSVGVWTYSVGAALVPVAATAGVQLAVSLLGYLLSLLLPGVGPTAWTVARWTWLVLFPAGLLTGAVLLVMCALVGCTQAFRLEALIGLSTGIGGLLAMGIVGAGVVWAFRAGGVAVGLIAVAVAVLLAAGIAVGGILAARGNGELR